MIRAVFYRAGGHFVRVRVSGHAGYADAGGDIVCASVTSAVQLAANGITEVLGQPAQVSANGDTVEIGLCGCAQDAQLFIQALYLHLQALTEQFYEYLDLNVLEK